MRNSNWQFCGKACAILAFLFAARPANAATIVLDWGTNANWTAGNLTQSFDIDATNPGVDITITITYNGAGTVAGSPSQTTGSPNGPELTWDTSTLTDATNVLIEILFLYATGVSNVNFVTNDVDVSGPGGGEVVNGIFADFLSGADLAATITPGSENTVNNNGTLAAELVGTAVSSSTASNATFSFGSAAIDRVRFSFTRVAGNNAPGNSLMRIDTISFDTADGVPEPASYALLGAGLGALALVKRHR